MANICKAVVKGLGRMVRGVPRQEQVSQMISELTEQADQATIAVGVKGYTLAEVLRCAANALDEYLNGKGDKSESLRKAVIWYCVYQDVKEKV